MATVLKSVTTFNNLAVGVPTALPHGLLDALGAGLVPDKAEVDVANVVVLSANTVNVTVRNDNANPVTVRVLSERWHSEDRALPPGQIDLTPQPFVVAASGGGGNVAAAGNLGDNKIIRGDGGLTDIQDSLPEIDDAGDIQPPTDGTLNVGIAAARFATMQTRVLIAATGTPTITPPINPADPQVAVVGVSQRQDSGYPAYQTVTAQGIGSAIFGKVGRAYGYPGTGVASMTAGNTYFNGYPSFILGSAFTYGNYDARMRSLGYGSLIVGHAAGYGADANMGVATGYPLANGAMVQGYVFGNYYPSGIYADSHGSFAGGSVAGGYVWARGVQGNWCFGAVNGPYEVSATGARGSWAFGYTGGGDNVQADGINCGQFGVGTNLMNDSFQFGGYGGGGLRIKLTDGAPGAGIRDGDVWLDSGALYARTGGVSVELGAHTTSTDLELGGADELDGTKLAASIVALTDAANVAIDCDNGLVWKLITTAGVGASRNISAPSNPQAGMTFLMMIKQANAGGPYTVNWNAVFKFPSGTAPTLSTTADKVDVITGVYDATDAVWRCTFTLNYD